MNPDPVRVQVSGATALVAVMPHMLGFHPEDSLVVAGLAGPRSQARLLFRFDLPDPPGRAAAREIADYTAAMHARHDLHTTVVIGYGRHLSHPRHRRPAQVLSGTATRIHDILRVDEGRYWSYTCQNLACCPPEVTPVAISHPAAEKLEAAGLRAAASRSALAAAIAPVTGPEAGAMTRPASQAGQEAIQQALRDGGGAVDAAALAAVLKAIGGIPGRRQRHRPRRLRADHAGTDQPAGPQRRLGADDPPTPRSPPPAVDRPHPACPSR